MSAADDLEVARFVRAVNDQIKLHIGNGHTMAFGNVVTASPLTILVDGSQTPVPAVKDRDYAPSIGDRVYAHVVRHQYVVAGAIG